MSIPLHEFVNTPRKYDHNGDSVSGGGRLKTEYYYDGKNTSPTSIMKQKRDSGAFLVHKDMYAGAKFSEHPHPTQLPKPPIHWVLKSCGASSPKNNASRSKPRRYTEAQ